LDWAITDTSYSVPKCCCIQRGHFKVEHFGGDEHERKYVHTTLLFLLLLLSLEFCPLTPIAFYFTFSRFYLWIVITTAPTSSYSVQCCFQFQRGSFQVEHCGGDDHAIQYVHSTLLCLLLLLSLEFCPLTFSSSLFPVFSYSGFKRTLCGGAWLSLTGSNNAFARLGFSTARYGCCDAGSYMSNPNQNPFVKGTSCSSCPAGQDGTKAAINDEISCCATVTGGSCTACSSFLASSCNAVTCNANNFDTNGFAADGCEAGCAAVPNGICSTCTTAAASGCTAVTCNTGYENFDNDATNGCEVACTAVPNGICAFKPSDSAALKAAVGTCLGETAGGSCPIFAASNDATGTPYGLMSDWDVSKVTSLSRSTSTPPLFFLLSLASFT
jgi:hypothetical protein